MSKITVSLVGVVRSAEDSRKPYALKLQFAYGIVTQPCTSDELFEAFRQIVDDAVSQPLQLVCEIRREKE